MQENRVDDAICEILLSGEHSYNKLWNEASSRTECAIATFNKHLKRLVKEGEIERIPQKNSQYVIYKMPPSQLHTILNLKSKIQSFEKTLKEEIKNFESFIKALEGISKKELHEFYKDPTKFDGLTSRLMEMYHYSTVLSFFNTSGILPKATIRRFKDAYNTYSEELEKTMSLWQKIDPESHNKTCVYILKKLKFNQ